LSSDFIKIVTKNRKARHNFQIEDEFEAGLVLTGTEVKSLRNGRANLKDAYAKISNGEVFLYQMHISAYTFAHYDNHPPERPRKLLLHKREIKRLYGKVNEKGFSLVPLQVYFKSGKAKVTIAIAKGKRTFDKREDIKKKDMKRELDRARRRNR